MADQNTCDLCGKLILGDPLRYELKIEIRAGYDIMEITEKDLERDLKKELDVILRQISRMDPEELEKQVYEVFNFDLCTGCRSHFRKDPLGRAFRLSSMKGVTEIDNES